MKITGLLNFCIFISFIFIFGGCAHSKSSQFWMPKIDYEKEILPNGLTVLYVQGHTSPIISFTSLFRVGSLDEDVTKTGLAHLFEHLMFKRSKKFGLKPFLNLLQTKGSIVNAYTKKDVTGYYEVFPAQNLALVVELEADRLSNFLLTEKDLKSELEVVFEERRMRIGSNFSAQQFIELEKNAFPNHPYGRPVIGYEEDIRRLTVDDCRKFFSNFYNPSNLTIVIAGDFEINNAKKIIRRFYGPIKSPIVIRPKLSDVKIHTTDQVIHLKRPVHSESLLIGYYSPSAFDDDYLKLNFAIQILLGLQSSRGVVNLVREKKVALSVGADLGSDISGNLLTISINLMQGVGFDKIKTELDDLIQEFLKNGPSEQEMVRVKNALAYSLLNEAKTVFGLSSRIATGEFYWKNPRKLFEIIEGYQNITKKDVLEVSRKYLTAKNRVFVEMSPR